ncbi:LysM peptidoglycan-binding domain-containing protein [Paenibacillus sp. J2TS4]|uniref:LysM peptidoglycan-binding domain-containing protein n=1 Tax=Paenibacillus sp. J2TS4 TaxID=2807194 RepID=UPI001B058E41|nr:LysM peptidoglycan-binding domain-containing protein [Paenibacillus sp. J2TS4]GIP31354.1 stage VI sporulation protein D [Paenibacillus sp. J2TS4]
MTEHQSGLRFDVYERVHLDESLAGIQALEEIEMIPHIQVMQEEEQAVLKGNLWLTGTYLGDDGEDRRTLEHFIPVEITLPMNRIHRLEDIAVEIENFDIDLLSARSLNVTGVLSLHGIEVTSKAEEGWKEEEEFTVVHRAEDAEAWNQQWAAEAEMEERGQEVSERQEASAIGKEETRAREFPATEAEEKAQSKPVIRPEVDIRREPETFAGMERADARSRDEPVEPQEPQAFFDGTDAAQDGEEQSRTSAEQISVSFRPASPRSSPEECNEDGDQGAAAAQSGEDAETSANSVSWADSFFTVRSDDKSPDERVEIDLPELPKIDPMEPSAKPGFSDDGRSEQSESASNESCTSGADAEQQPVVERDRSQSGSEWSDLAGTDRSEGPISEEKAEAPVLQENEPNEFIAANEANQANQELAEAVSAEANEEAEEIIAVSMPEEKQELKIAFGKKSSSDPNPPYHLTNLVQKTDITELETDHAANTREQEAAEKPAAKEGVEWKRLFIREEGAENQFKRMRMCIVQKEDSIDTIAERYNINPREIILCNRLGDQPIEEGQVLYIP